MKLGFFVSSALHVMVIFFGLFSLSAPRVLQVADIEALSVEIISASQTQTIKGEKKASSDNPPSLEKTDQQNENQEAIHIGDGKKDIQSDSENNSGANKAEIIPQKNESENAANTNTTKDSIAALTTQNQELTAEETKTITLPKKVPTPQPRPKVIPQQTTQEEQQEKQDEISALVNRQQQAAGGLVSSQSEAGQGARQGTNDKILSQNELDALRARIQSCWNVGALVGSENADSLRAKVEFRLNPDGTIAKEPEVDVIGGTIYSQQAFAGGAKRAIVRCAPYQLPLGKYEEWADVVVHFSLKDML